MPVGVHDDQVPADGKQTGADPAVQVLRGRGGDQESAP